jgi:hypothetical protein
MTAKITRTIKNKKGQIIREYTADKKVFNFKRDRKGRVKSFTVTKKFV